ncbi:50S ribosomal protein l24 [Niveomyces insectorum RCEF 264]|uniref:Large ribosomal subunit protein bL28m n=1 Tax=Niveomyces insectorum RCEF 264 TaxID=1081102 RepID=A0A167P076_9HYPO|nr:50S ribosomal protein l24 [Niveomyces insectorum RCEF 264]
MSAPLRLRSRGGQRVIDAVAIMTPCSSLASSTTAASLHSFSARNNFWPQLTRQKQQLRGYKQVRPHEGPPIPSPTAQQPEIPPYPLGPRLLYKQSNTGLYGNARIRFGNTVSRETEIINPQKNRRKWRPNIHEKRLFSEALGVSIRTRISARVLRTVDKAGGLDEYLLGSKPARISELGPWGWRLRWRIMQTQRVQERFRREREALGLPARDVAIESFDEEGACPKAGATSEGDSVVDYVEETQNMIDGDAVFDLAPEEGFMREETGRKSSL